MLQQRCATVYLRKKWRKQYCTSQQEEWETARHRRTQQINAVCRGDYWLGHFPTGRNCKRKNWAYCSRVHTTRTHLHFNPVAVSNEPLQFPSKLLGVRASTRWIGPSVDGEGAYNSVLQVSVALRLQVLSYWEGSFNNYVRRLIGYANVNKCRGRHIPIVLWNVVEMKEWEGGGAKELGGLSDWVPSRWEI